MSKAKEAFRRAIEKAGSQTELARVLATNQSRISYVLTQAKRIPPDIAIAVDKFTNGEIAKHELRPDLFEAA